MARPADIPGTERKVNKVGGRSRNLERRFVVPEGAIRFDFDNVGDWLDIRTTGVDGSGFGMHFVADKPIKFELGGTGSDGLFTVDAYSVLIETTGATGTLGLGSAYALGLTAQGALDLEGGASAIGSAGLHLQATHGNLELVSNLGVVGIDAPTSTVWLQGNLIGIGGRTGVTDGVAVAVVLDTAATLTVADHTGATIFSIDEATGTTHTHGATVADL